MAKKIINKLIIGRFGRTTYKAKGRLRVTLLIWWAAIQVIHN